jgi:hypothetical protein
VFREREERVSVSGERGKSECFGRERKEQMGECSTHTPLEHLKSAQWSIVNVWTSGCT